MLLQFIVTEEDVWYRYDDFVYSLNWNSNYANKVFKYEIGDEDKQVFEVYENNKFNCESQQTYEFISTKIVKKLIAKNEDRCARMRENILDLESKLDVLKEGGSGEVNPYTKSYLSWLDEELEEPSGDYDYLLDLTRNVMNDEYLREIVDSKDYYNIYYEIEDGCVSPEFGTNRNIVSIDNENLKQYICKAIDEDRLESFVEKNIYENDEGEVRERLVQYKKRHKVEESTCPEWIRKVVK